MARPIPSENARWPPLRLGWWGLLPFLVALLAFATTLDAFFVSDDFQMLHRAATAPNWISASHLPYTEHVAWVRPISQWSWWLQWQTSGLEPLAYRLFNVSLHGLNAALVAWLAAVLLPGPRGVLRGAFAGVAFALAPIHPEAVTWLSGRVDLLCTFGVLVALLAWARFLSEGGRTWHVLLAAGAFALALGAKEMAATFPLLAVLVWWRPFHLADRRSALLGLALFGALLGGYLALRLQLLGGLGGIAAETGASLQSRFDVPHALGFAVDALRLALVPLHTQFHPGGWHPLLLLQVLGLVLLLGFTLSSSERRSQLVGLGRMLLLFAVTILPIAGWAHVNTHVFLSSRYLYLPTVFTSLLLGHLVAAAPRRFAALGLLVLVPWTYQLFEVNAAWDRAARTVERALQTLPPADEVPRLCLTDLPDNDGGAFVLRVGFPLAIQLFTERQGPIRVESHSDWATLRAASLARGASTAPFLRWDSDLGWTSDL